MDIQITGARPGEKLFEELFTSGEERQSRVHPKVFESVQDPRDHALLDRSLRSLQNIISYPGQRRHREILECFMQLVPSYRPSPTGFGRCLAAGPFKDPGAHDRTGLPAAPLNDPVPDPSDLSAIA
jgi:hypothetical protein